MYVMILLGVANVALFCGTLMVLIKLKKALRELREAQDALKEALVTHGLLREGRLPQTKSIEHSTLEG